MKVSILGTRFLCGWEGFRSCPYKIGSDPWTRGYGETRGIGPNSPCVSRRQARAEMRRRLNRDYLPPVMAVLRQTGDQIRQREADGLASVSYNLGPGVVSDPRVSTLARRLQSAEARTFKGRKRIYREELPKWRMPGSQFEAGLAKRRAAEVALICNGNYLGRP